MSRKDYLLFGVTLMLLLPVASKAAPPPYWPYPPSPYYYPPPSGIQSVEKADTPVPNAINGEDEAATTPAANNLPPENQLDTKIATEPQTTSFGSNRSEESLDEEAAAESKSTTPRHPLAPTIDKAAFAEQRLNEALSREIALDIQQGNFAEAYYLWRPRAEAGDAEAQYGIGWMYHNGYGLAINDQEAITWWQMASRQGHTEAAFALGMLYTLGEGAIKRDMKRAVDYYHQAARMGHEDARLLLLTLLQEKDRNAHRLMLTLLDEGRLSEISNTPPAEVISKRANVRQGSSTQHKILTTLSKGHTLFPIKRNGRWLLVGIADKEYLGWIHDSLVGKDILKEK